MSGRFELRPWRRRAWTWWYNKPGNLLSHALLRGSKAACETDARQLGLESGRDGEIECVMLVPWRNYLRDQRIRSLACVIVSECRHQGIKIVHGSRAVNLIERMDTILRELE